MTNAERQKCNAPISDNVTRVTVACVTLDELDKGLEGGPSLEHYKVCPDKYATRAQPELLNWGPWMDTAQLAGAGLRANRVPVPGDWDYT